MSGRSCRLNNVGASSEERFLKLRRVSLQFDKFRPDVLNLWILYSLRKRRLNHYINRLAFLIYFHCCLGDWIVVRIFAGFSSLDVCPRFKVSTSWLPRSLPVSLEPQGIKSSSPLSCTTAVYLPAHGRGPGEPSTRASSPLLLLDDWHRAHYINRLWPKPGRARRLKGTQHGDGLLLIFA